MHAQYNPLIILYLRSGKGTSNVIQKRGERGKGSSNIQKPEIANSYGLRQATYVPEFPQQAEQKGKVSMAG